MSMQVLEQTQEQQLGAHTVRITVLFSHMQTPERPWAAEQICTFNKNISINITHIKKYAIANNVLSSWHVTQWLALWPYTSSVEGSSPTFTSVCIGFAHCLVGFPCRFTRFPPADVQFGLISACAPRWIGIVPHLVP